MLNRNSWLLIFLIPQIAWAEFSLKKFKSISLSFGNWMEYSGAVQTSKNSDDLDLNFTPYFSAAIEYAINDDSSFIPEIGYIVQRKAGDDKITKDLFFLRTDYSYKYNEWLRFRAGTSFMVLSISSNGGSEKLPNGNGDETYYLPSERRTAINQTLDLGVETIFEKNYAIRLQTYIYSPFISEERILTYSLSVSYLFGPKDL